MKNFDRFLTEHRKCIICNKEYTSIWARCKSNKAVQCDCGFVWMDPYLNEEGIKIYYAGYLGNSYGNKKKREERSRQYQIDKLFIDRFLPRGKRKNKILDIGCSDGKMLDCLDYDRFDKFGVDIDAMAIKNGNNLNNTLFLGEIEDMPSSFKNFDAVILRGVIQHLYNPTRYMKKIYSVLKKGGKLFILATPNVDSFCANLYREKWNLFDPIAHILYFNDNTIEVFLKKYGFCCIGKEFPYLETPYCNAKKDYKSISDSLKRGEFNKISPPFWGNIMNIAFNKND